VLSVNKTTPEMIKLVENPVRNSLRFNVTAKSGTTATVRVFDISGRKLINQQLKVQKGMNAIAIELDNKIPAGIYLLEFSSGTESAVTRFLKN
jgi:hypothetical protein